MLDLFQISPNPVASDYLARLAAVLGRVPADRLARAVDVLLEAREAGRRVYALGNGGSAATASHLVCDLMKTAQVPGFAPLRAVALTDNAAVMTAWANDTSYDRGFAEQILALADPGDVLIAISASGNSANVVAALRAALARGLTTIGLLGFDGGAARDLVDVSIHVPVDDYGLAEDCHSAIGHALTAAVRAALLGERVG